MLIAKTVSGRNSDGTAVFAEMSVPALSAADGVWTSTVRCAALFPTDKRVAGADADQALELAEMLLRELFAHHNIEIE